MWGLLSTCPSQTQDPLADQDKCITRLGSLYLDQDKLRLTQEVRSFPSSTILDRTDRQNRLDLSDGHTMPNEIGQTKSARPFRLANQSNQVLKISDMRG